MKPIFRSLVAAAALVPAIVGCHSHQPISKLSRTEAEKLGLLAPREGKVIPIPSADTFGQTRSAPHNPAIPDSTSQASTDKRYIERIFHIAGEKPEEASPQTKQYPQPITLGLKPDQKPIKATMVQRFTEQPL